MSTFIPLVPFLPVRDDFHPKRNQARQKLATLPTGRFKDLSSDVYYELARRYPEFKEEVRHMHWTRPSCWLMPLHQAPDAPTSAVSAGSAYDDFPSPDFPRNGRTSEDRGNDSGYGGSTPGASTGDTYSRRKPSQDIYAGSDRRRPSQDTTLGRRPSESASVTSGGDAQSATAGMGMIIPNKSTIAEEEIEVPYGRDSNMTARNRNGGGLSDSERDQEDDLSPRSPPERALGGLSGLSARLQQADDGEDYYDRASFGRQSVASDRSAGGGSKTLGGRTSVAGDEERVRREYEFKIATMQKRIAGLERDLEDVQDREQKWADGENRVRTMEQELNELRRVSVGQASSDAAMSIDIIFASELKRRVPRCCRYSRNWTL